MSQLLSPFLKARLLTPGPTPSPEWAKLAAASADIYHRSPAFVPYIKRCQMNLARYFGSKQHPIILTSSGTGAMEAAVLNFTDPEDEVLVLVAGKFGERWAQIADTFQCKVHSLKVEWGNTTDFEAILEQLKLKPGITKIFLQATETSTGVFHPIDQWLPKLRPLFTGLIIVDAISALLAHSIKMDEWGIDVCLAASQKGFGVAPGLAFVCVAEAAWNKMSKRGAYYFNLQKEREAQCQGTTSWTSATTLIKELDAVLEYLAEFQIEEITNHHRVLASGNSRSYKSNGP
jgi:aspartate aminotransferase-like enzyme